METFKTITIYDVPDRDPSASKSAEIDVSPFHSRDTYLKPDFPPTEYMEEKYIESSIPSILIKNIIYNCIPIEYPANQSAAGGRRPISALQTGDQRSICTSCTGGRRPISALQTGGKLARSPNKGVQIVADALDEPKLEHSDSAANVTQTSASATKSLKSELIDDKYVLHVQFPIALLVYIVGKGFVVRAAGDTIAMSGVWFDSSQTFNQSSYIFYSFRGTSIQNRAMMGVLGLKQLTSRYRYPKVPRIANFFTHSLLPDAFSERQVAVRFTSDADAINKIQQIQRFMLSREMQYGNMFPQTMKQLSALTTDWIDFRANGQPMNHSPIKPSRAQSVVGDLLRMRFIDRDCAISTIYSGPMRSFYLKTLAHGTTREMLEKERKSLDVFFAHAHVRNQAKTSQITANSMIAWREAIARREFHKAVSGLTQAEKEVVNTTHAREIVHARSVTTNRCPHVRLYKGVMNSRDTSFDTQKWAKLKEYLENPTNSRKPNSPAEIPHFDAMIPCQRCKLAAICPHYYVMFEYKSSLFENDEEKLMQYILEHMASGADSSMAAIADGNYCRICGELLQKISAVGETWAKIAKGSDEVATDQLHIQIMDEVDQTLNTNLDAARSAINKATLITSISNTISPWIRRYELKLSRIKTNTNRIISLSLSLIIAIYTMMTLAHLVVLSGGSGVFIRTAQVKDETGLKLVHLLFNRIYKLVIAQYANVIEEVIAFTPDRIKKIMTSAYARVSGAPVVIETVTVKYHTDLITDNPFYRFLVYGWRVGELMRNADARKIVPRAQNTVKSVIGAEIADLNEMQDFFAKAPMPAKWPNAGKDPYIDYVWDAYSATIKNLTNGTFELDGDTMTARAKEYAGEVKTREKLVWDERAHDAPYAYINKNLAGISMHAEYREYETVRDFNRVFCPTGHAHDWKVYVFNENDASLADAKESKGSAQHEYKASEFKDAERIDARFKAMKCARCSSILCSAAAADDSKTVDRAYNQAKVRGFFIYYRIRCPEKTRGPADDEKQHRASGFHVWKDKKCVQCALSVSPNEQEKSEYFAKYVDSFDLERSAMKWSATPNAAALLAALHEEQPLLITAKKDEYKAWVSQNIAITTASKTFTQLPYNLLINIGLVAGTHIATITAGKSNPSNSAKDAQWYIQARAVLTYISDLAVAFNKFAACATHGMHPDLTEFCERNSDEVHELKQIDLAPFNAERQWRLAREKSSVYANWILNRLCELLLEIYERKTPSGAAKRFADIFADAILLGETNMSKPIVYKNIVIASANAQSRALDLADAPEAPETDIEAKDFIKNVLDQGEGFGTDNVDVESYADSFGDDVI